jgi:hypothetical protein
MTTSTPLSGTEQAEGEQQRAARQPERGLGRLLVELGSGGHAVRDHAHLRRVDAAALDQQLHRPVASTTRRRSGPRPGGWRALLGRRVRQDGVQRRHDRHPHVLEQLVDVRAGVAPEDAELVLHAEHVEVGAVDVLGGRAEVLDAVGVHLEDDLGAVLVGAAVVGQGDLDGRDVGPGGGQGPAQVVGERGDAAPPRGRGADQHRLGRSVVLHVGTPSHGHCARPDVTPTLRPGQV